MPASLHELLHRLRVWRNAAGTAMRSAGAVRAQRVTQFNELVDRIKVGVEKLSI